ncbi:hypothetical protein [Paenibacillus borealis]|nr:hypothetical protein [Paenibacillus borealis]
MKYNNPPAKPLESGEILHFNNNVGFGPVYGGECCIMYRILEISS